VSGSSTAQTERTCAVCGARAELIANWEGELVCQPSVLWHRADAAHRRVYPGVGDDVRDAYFKAMSEHKLVRPRARPLGLDEPILPCGLTPRRVRAWGTRSADPAG